MLALFSSLLLLVACGELSTPGEQLRILTQPFEPAYINEVYNASVRAAGGLSPYQYHLEAGQLPPGIELQGSTLRGVPTELGRYTFTISVVDANLSRTFQEYTIEVTEPPPAELRLNTPTTEMRTPFLLRGEIKNARELQAFRTLVTWDPARFTLTPGSIRALRRNVTVLEDLGEGELHLDVAVLGGALNGDQALFELELTPLEPSTIEVQARTEFVSRDGRHAFSSTREGTRATAPVPPPAEDPFAIEDPFSEDDFPEDADEEFGDGEN